MPKNTSISLGEPYLEFIDRQIAKGRFATASEAVRAGLRLLEEQEIALEKLRVPSTKGTPHLTFPTSMPSSRG